MTRGAPAKPQHDRCGQWRVQAPLSPCREQPQGWVLGAHLKHRCCQGGQEGVMQGRGGSPQRSWGPCSPCSPSGWSRASWSTWRPSACSRPTTTSRGVSCSSPPPAPWPSTSCTCGRFPPPWVSPTSCVVALGTSALSCPQDGAGSAPDGARAQPRRGRRGTQHQRPRRLHPCRGGPAAEHRCPHRVLHHLL